MPPEPIYDDATARVNLPMLGFGSADVFPWVAGAKIDDGHHALEPRADGYQKAPAMN